MLHLDFSYKYFRDIRFWIVLFFVIRLYGITMPPLEVAHNWRQATVAMVARNFYEGGPEIFYPRIDIAGEKTGITGMEFPLLNYLVYASSKVFGYQHWYGRLINLLISSIGIYYFFKLSRKYFSAEIAFNASLILLCSMWFIYSRKIMPDTFAVSLLITGLYFGSNYLDSGHKFRDLLLYLLLVTLGMLAKLPAACLMLIPLIMIANPRIPTSKRLLFISVTAISFLAPLLWYFYWVPFLVREYGFWHFFMGESIKQGLTELIRDLPLTLEQFYSNALKFIGFGAFILGLIYGILGREKRLLVVFGLSFLAFLVIMLKSGSTFAHHSYYMVPFVPVMALVGGFGISMIKNKKIAMMILLAIGLEGLANQQHDFKIKPDKLGMLNLESDLDKVSKRSDLILINSDQVPTPMYFAHRKGWVNSNSQISDSLYLSDLKQLGLKYVVILKKGFGTEIKMNLPLVLPAEDYTIYRLQP